MKWIKSRQGFLNEAKIRDVILEPQKKAIIDAWGERILDLEEIEPTDKIIQGKWKLSEEDKMEALSIFFSSDLNEVYEFFLSLPNEFKNVIEKSIDFDLLKSDNKWLRIFNNFDINKPTINQISNLSENVFRKISMSESQAAEIIIRDEAGRPILDEETKRPLKRRREEGEIIFSRNLVNINGITEDYNRLFPSKTVDDFKFRSGEVLKVISASKEDFGGDGYQVEVDVYGKDLFLSIKHNPKDILNMSVSRFYGSCQHLYRGGYRSQLVANVFDPNSIPAFLVFDSPILDYGGTLISEQLPLTRMMIRNIIDPSDDKTKLYFDRAYPDRMKDFFNKIVEKYSPNKQSSGNEDYIFTPDIPEDLYIDSPYMDRKDLVRKKALGVNSKYLTFAASSNWSDVVILPGAKIQEINFETTKIPENFFDLKIDLKLIRYRYMKIFDLAIFNKLKSNSWAFEKCQLSSDVIHQLLQTQGDTMEALEFTGCDLSNIDFSKFDNLKELRLIFTMDETHFRSMAQNLKVKKLVISGDLASGKENKSFINSLKSRGIKIETVGPVI